MGWEERPYQPDHGGAYTNPIVRAFSASVPVGHFLGVQMRVHVSLLVFLAVGLPVAHYHLATAPMLAQATVVFLASLILHELAHCLTARRLDGTADEAVLWPLGGLSMPQPPPQPFPTLLTVLAGPAMTFLLCALGAMGFYLISRSLPTFNPFYVLHDAHGTWNEARGWFWWLFAVNFLLLIFNVLPIFPLDGGHALQSMLWRWLGEMRSIMFALAVGMALAMGMSLIGMSQGRWDIAALGLFMFFECLQRRNAVRESGIDQWGHHGDYGPSLFSPAKPSKKRRGSRTALRRARRIALAEKAERDRIDSILAKVSVKGIQGITWLERRILRKTTARQRRREQELSRFQ